MASAIVRGLLNTNAITPTDILITGRTDDGSKDSFLNNFPECQNCWRNSTQETITDVDTILLAVKPQQMNDVLPTIKSSSTVSSALIISIAAGITLDYLEKHLMEKARIIRTMPNTPLLLGEGATAYAVNQYALDSDKVITEDIFRAVGLVFEVEEKQLDAVTALSGSGPAYFYLFIEALQQAAIKHGLDPDIALKLANQTAKGASLMIENSEKSPEYLIDQVKSKGGTTEAALNSFSEHSFSEIIEKAFQAAHNRSIELGKNLKSK